MKVQYESQLAVLSQHDARTKVPHLLIELRSLGYIEVCGKDTGGIYERLRTYLTQNFRCSPATLCLRSQADLSCGCCVTQSQAMLPMQDWDKVCDMNLVCGQQSNDGSIMPNGVFQSRGNQGENNMGQLTMAIVNFMTHECGWGLQLCDGGNLGTWGQYREQQIKFKAPHPLNMIAPHLMIELRQVGFIEVNGPNTGGIHEKIGQWFATAWGAKQVPADPIFCTIKFATGAFKQRGSQGENNMGMRTMELVDFMTKNCAWTAITCNGGNFGRTGKQREQQLVFRNDEHVQQGENHVMIELRDQGYVEVNGIHDAPDADQAIEAYFKQRGCTDYKTGMFESSEKFCDKKYTTPGGYYYRQGTTNNLGKITIDVATMLGTKGWMLMLCNGGNVSDYNGYNIKREQQVKFTRARQGENATAPLLMIELRTLPVSYNGQFRGLVEVNGPNTNGIYEKLSAYMQQTMMASPAGPTPYCDYLFNVNCFRCRNNSNNEFEMRRNGYLNGESNFGKYTMRLCDFMVDHVGEWELIVCNGNSIDTVFRINKDDTRSCTGREQQLVFRHRPGGRNVFMAQDQQLVALGRPPLQPPKYWTEGSRNGTAPHTIVPATPEEKACFQKLMDGTYKAKITRDRDKGTPLPERYIVVSALRSEHPGLWDKFAQRRSEVLKRVKARNEEQQKDLKVPKTLDASPELCANCSHPTIGNPTNEHFLFHGSNPTSAQSILNTSFKVDFAGASAGTMFGPGIYLAEASSKADEYAKDENTGGAYDGLFAVLICRAVVGRSYVTQKPGDFKEQCLEGNFDSVLGDREAAVGTYREFIFFHEGSVYPEYVVFYKRQYADGVAPPVSAPAAPTPVTIGAPSQQAMPVTLAIVVPEGQGPGSVLQVQTPDGRAVNVTVPEGVSEGQTIQVQC